MCTKCVWTKSQLPLINSALNDNISEHFHSEFINAILDLRDVEDVTLAFNDYVNQIRERVCNLRKAKPRKKRRRPAWFDPECRFKRSEDLRLCDLASRDIEQIRSAVQSCKSYKATKQREKCEYMRRCLQQLETAFDANRTEMWIQGSALLTLKSFYLKAFNRKHGCDWLMLKHQPITATLSAKSF